jgi:hypothetical protein
VNRECIAVAKLVPMHSDAMLVFGLKDANDKRDVCMAAGTQRDGADEFGSSTGERDGLVYERRAIRAEQNAGLEPVHADGRQRVQGANEQRQQDEDSGRHESSCSIVARGAGTLN